MKTARDRFDCTMDKTVPAGVEIDAEWEMVQVPNYTPRVPAGSGADGYAELPAKGPTFHLSGP